MFKYNTDFLYVFACPATKPIRRNESTIRKYIILLG